MAHEMFTMYRDGLRQALASAPEILFICVAGNDNQDSTFQESIPASFVLPNLLTVGAVDQSGRETPFTSYGSTVAVHANGYEVESFIPGGGTMRASGTSMAAPAVTNLAAKLFALNPSLKPTDVINLIKSGADRAAADHLMLINPRHSVVLLRAKN